MADAPKPPGRREASFAQRELQTRINQAETFAMGLLGVGGLVLLVGFILALLGNGILFLLLGGIMFLAGGIENVRAEILKLRAKLVEKD